MSGPLPWERFQPDPPTPEPPPEGKPVLPPPTRQPVEPPEPSGGLPGWPESVRPAPDVNAAALIRTSVTDALDDIWPALKQQALDYAYAAAAATAVGGQVDHTRPTITTTTPAGKQLVIADAKSRSWRTLVQGLCIDLFVALIAVLAAISDANPFQKETWILLGALLIKTFVQTAAAYLMRLKVTPTMKTEGETLAIMPIPRPMLETDTTERELP